MENEFAPVAERAASVVAQVIDTGGRGLAAAANPWSSRVVCVVAVMVRSSSCRGQTSMLVIDASGPPTGRCCDPFE